MKQTLSPEVPDPNVQKAAKRAERHDAVSFFVKVIVTALVVFALHKWVAGIYICHENAAYPMVKDGDLCLAFRLAELRQGDAVVYRENDTIRFGRVIASAGDSVEISGDAVTVNSFSIYEEAVYPTVSDGAKISFPYVVPENCVFVLNDYRKDVSDSRTFGGIPLEDIEGKIIFMMRSRGI